MPRAYVLPKSKDLRKGRPIVPYWKHCLRSVYRIVGRALNYFLAGHEATGFNISRTDSYVKEVKTKQKEAIDRYGKDLRWSLAIGDIANMYTELPHASIDAAVEWGLLQPQIRGRSTRTKLVAVHRRSRDIHMGRALGPGYAELTQKELMDVAKYDNDHMYVVIRGAVCRHRHGAPMGSNIAPAKAQMTLSKAECVTSQRATEMNMIVIAVRFMDDVMAAAAYDATDDTSKANADWFCAQPSRIYPHPLHLDVEPEAEQHRFLETTTSWNGRTIRVQHSNHNGAAMLAAKPLKRLNRPSPVANISDTEAVLGLYGELHRVSANCTDNLAVVQAMSELWMELHEFTWPKQWLLRALNMYMKKCTNPVWEYVYESLENL